MTDSELSPTGAPAADTLPSPAPDQAPETEIVVELPGLYCPKQPRRHPQVDLVHERGMAWMERHGFCTTPQSRKRVADTASADFFGAVCPDADPELLQPGADWCYLMFIFDDRHCDEDLGDYESLLDLSLRIARTLEVPRCGVLDPRRPFTTAVVDLAERLHQTAPPPLIRRLADAHRAWLLGAARSRAGRSGKALSPDDYLLIRMLDCGGLPTLVWIELSDPRVIPEQQIVSPAVRALTEMALLVAALDNDLFSYGKELWLAAHTSAAMPANVVNQFMASHDYGLQDALRDSVALRDRIVHRFVEVHDQVIPDADAPLARYLSNLTCLIPGNLDVGLRSGRYRDPDGMHPNAVRTIATMTGTPSAIGPPPDAPSIAGWWETDW